MRLLLLAALLAPVQAIVNDCLRKADHTKINALFSNGGPGTKVYLCPGTEVALSGTIVFTAADQELATFGYPGDDRRAKLRIASDAVATAIQGDCRRCARVAVRNLVIDGARRKYGRVRDPNSSPGLVILGGNEGQAVRECAISDPRGFTAVHVREGAKLNCQGALIERNEITSVGEEYDPAYDGTDPESSPWGRPLADGISIACRNSVVRDNLLTDCTDAGIVVYCSPGTKIENNRVSTERRSAIGGILLVDAQPFNGDYSGVIVKDNTLDASARIMRIGIGLGLSILSDDIETMLKGGSVISNRLTGDYMGYGIAAAGLQGWTIKDNLDEARYEGQPSDRCFDDPINPPPQAFIYNSATLDKSTVQDGFFDSDFAYIVCIDGPGEAPFRYSAESEQAPQDSSDGSEHDISAPDEHEPPQSATEARITDPGLPPPEILPGGLLSTGNSMLDGILLHSQQRLLDRIDEITSGVHVSVTRSLSMAPPAGDAVTLHARLAELEHSQARLLSATHDVHLALSRLRTKTHEVGLWESDVLLSIQQEVEPIKKRDQVLDDLEDDGNASVFDLPVRVILLGGCCSAVALAVRRFRRPVHDKIV
ncbi:hypothetical protein CcaverHIS002_0107120 [Cutaneotrichosporon cavernicola]|uniref:Right handed beta helix domain-containing protein n=1 Tax=Cutaneotrichosporon cavernicola TaxID=279322 RepID=A0AA48I6J5_9TREE|nr:uncharacterized protein CcaverHIS019_0107080 [Cutaneotrichosporon cavernicola]BEI80183.1 hypothetical protein CcaverHIS002_0107120 [Cutaneotrichosporon cavernicola]BEI87990.1 hypothetical protein CcaverHIS019_0107080 [Cutaneotrichosporon cavernicola]BEI95766.1 hypothetical protein CcaverHIS631_0107150 [Cutaneotrichosporon cavernicola]BEJ03538.1 hypothetical protein CcaverHIS641_0107130 [Cutaneotrichosporon cavernicola]